MAETDSTYEIKSEARGPHWVAWLTRGGDSRPVQSVVLVGQTRDEAESRAKGWGERLRAIEAAGSANL